MDNVMLVIVCTFGFVMWSLIVWCAAASIWYNKGLEEHSEKVKTSDRWYEEYQKLKQAKWNAINHLNFYRGLSNKLSEKINHIKLNCVIPPAMSVEDLTTKILKIIEEK